jgi:hypothetical protein
MTTSRRQGNPWALGGVLFAVFFIAGDVPRGMLTSNALPLPGASAAEVARYFTDNQTAVLVVAAVQILSALSLLVFVAPVATFARRAADDEGTLPRLASGGGVLSTLLLLASALLGGSTRNRPREAETPALRGWVCRIRYANFGEAEFSEVRGYKRIKRESS